MLAFITVTTTGIPIIAILTTMTIIAIIAVLTLRLFLVLLLDLQGHSTFLERSTFRNGLGFRFYSLELLFLE